MVWDIKLQFKNQYNQVMTKIAHFMFSLAETIKNKINLLKNVLGSNEMICRTNVQICVLTTSENT